MVSISMCNTGLLTILLAALHTRADPTLMNQLGALFPAGLGWVSWPLPEPHRRRQEGNLWETDRHVEVGEAASNKMIIQHSGSVAPRTVFLLVIIHPDPKIDSWPVSQQLSPLIVCTCECVSACGCRILHAKTSAPSVSACDDNAACVHVRGYVGLTLWQWSRWCSGLNPVLHFRHTRLHPPPTPPNPFFLHAHSGRSLCF